NYNRILLSSVLAGTHRSSDITINSHAWYAANGVRLRTCARVERVVLASKTLEIADGTVEPYDVLILATGSRPLMPPIEGLFSADGSLREGISVFRTLDDCERIVSSARRARSACVIG